MEINFDSVLDYVLEKHPKPRFNNECRSVGSILGVLNIRCLILLNVQRCHFSSSTFTDGNHSTVQHLVLDFVAGKLYEFCSTNEKTFSELQKLTQFSNTKHDIHSHCLPISSWIFFVNLPLLFNFVRTLRLHFAQNSMRENTENMVKDYFV